MFEEFVVCEVCEDCFWLVLCFVGVLLLLYGYCYIKVVGVLLLVLDVLCLIFGVVFELVDMVCCGMVGSFGYEVEYYEVLMCMVEDGLLFVLCEWFEVIVVVDGSSCC